MRRFSREVRIGRLTLGGGAPVAVQTMTKTRADDVAGTLAQIRAAADAGADLVRCAVPSLAALPAFAEILRASPLPVVADVHYDWRIAVAAVEAGAPKVRVNPGNMAPGPGLEALAAAARARGAAIRVGVNSGSVRRDADDRRPEAEALADEALAHAERFAALGADALVLSIKAPTAAETVAANRALAARCDRPIHLGVTHAGPPAEAVLKSAVALGALLMDGIGDTVRVSMTGSPAAEVEAGLGILRAAGLRRDIADLVSCPTCGRCTVDLAPLVEAVRSRLREIPSGLTVAVMGCEVNGPGEAKEADVGLAAAGGRIALFVRGRRIGAVEPERAVEALIAEARALAASPDSGESPRSPRG